MSYGLNIFNSNGYSQIDGLFSSFEITQKGTLTNGANILLASSFEEYSKSLFFVAPPGPGYFIAGGYRPQNTNLFYIYVTSSPDGLTPGFPAGTWNYFIAKPITAKSNNPYGLEVYNQGGSILLDSGKEVFGIDAIMQINTRQTYPNYANYNFDLTTPALPVGKKRYMLIFPYLDQYYMETNPSGFGNTQAYRMAMNALSSTSIRYRQCLTGDATGETGDGGLKYWANERILGASAYL